MDSLHVVCSGGFAKAYQLIAPSFEQQTGIRLISSWGPSMGSTPDAIPMRLERGNNRGDANIDVVIMGERSLNELISEGKLIANSRVRLALSPIACAVKKHAPRPDISTIDKFKEALLNAQTIVYSDSVSEEYFKSELLNKLCNQPEENTKELILSKAKQILTTPVGECVARGDVELGIQQYSELKHIHHIDVVGFIPNEIQLKSAFSGAIVKASSRVYEARKLLEFLSAPINDFIIKETGLEPCNHCCGDEGY